MLILGVMASAWAACLVVLGMWLVIESPGMFLLSRRTIILVGISSIAAGNLVFMYSVADRLFPSIREGQVGWSIEMFTLAVILAPLIPLVTGAHVP